MFESKQKYQRLSVSKALSSARLSRSLHVNSSVKAVHSSQQSECWSPPNPVESHASAVSLLESGE